MEVSTHTELKGADCAPPPHPAPTKDSLPCALTFFLTAAQRKSVLCALQARSEDRSAALLSLIGVGAGSESSRT